jgi:hypothetical protein
MLEQVTSLTPQTTTRIHTTTPPSGASTGGWSRPPERSPGDPYGPLCDEIHRLLARKRGYYGCSESPLQNALGVAEDGIDPVRYQIARIGEKMRRLRGLSEDNGIRETLMDIAGHAIVGLACLDHKKAEGS